MTNKTADEQYMQQCFALALKAEGRTAPNPIVGALVVQSDGTVVGTGFHPKHGQPHAEVFAIDEAGEKARGATIYVSLEPCCHHGKTPPCTDKVIASGIKKVVAAMTDPNPKVGGKGFEKLRAAGIEVVTGILAPEAQWINRAFVKTIATGLPWITLKIAATLDGKIADRNGTSKWITGPEARRYVHELRNRLDCVLIGTETARTDDPELNVRELDQFRHPKRAVLDTNLSLKPDSRIFDGSTGGDTIIYCSKQALDKGHNLPSHVSVVAVPKTEANHVLRKIEGNVGSNSTVYLDLAEVLKDLRTRKVSSVLCEGGGVLAGSLIENDLVDEIIWIVAPAILGDNQARPGVAVRHEVKLAELKRYQLIESKSLGEDAVIHLKRKIVL
jgi:diaminohydroxyphosphoribosylaminopyrimidine deaminase/5-amino-6-(5-phosphoribosylamino)uracil reductase